MKKLFSFILAIYIISTAFCVSAFALDKVCNPPEISFSVQNGAVVSKFDKITVTINSNTDVNYTLKVDGNVCESIDTTTLSEGMHTAYVTATDSDGVTSDKTLIFNVKDKSASILLNEEEKEINVSAIGESILYTGMLLADVHLLENRVGEFDRNYLRCEDEVLISWDDMSEHITKAVGNSVPYQSFVVNTEYSTQKNVLVSYKGVTGNGADILLEAWNYVNGCWDKVAVAKSGDPISVSLDIKTYAYKKKMRVNASPILNYNGSDYFYWNSNKTDAYSINYDKANKFDLVSANNHDFLVLYLENNVTKETASWANAVCTMYKNRNVIIVPSNYFVSEYKYSDNSELIWNNIVYGNENVVAVLCNDFDGYFETVKAIGNRKVVECNTPNIESKITINGAEQIIITALDTKVPSCYGTLVFDLDFVECNRTIQTYEFYALTDFDDVEEIGKKKISLGGINLFFIESIVGDNTYYSEIIALDEFENDYNIDNPKEYTEPTYEKFSILGYSGLSGNVNYGIVEDVKDFVNVEFDLLSTEGRREVEGGDSVTIDVNKRYDFSKGNRLYFGVRADQYVAWDLVITYNDGSIEFVNNESIRKQLGFNSESYKVSGSWYGYIDLSEIVSGIKIIKDLKFTSLNNYKSAVLEYLFFGSSDMNSITLVYDTDIVKTIECESGNKLELPTLNKYGYTFDGWYTELENGTKVENSINFTDKNQVVYARYTKKEVEQKNTITYDKEINLERVSVWKLVFVAVCLAFMAIVIFVLRYKIKKSKVAKEN